MGRVKRGLILYNINQFNDLSLIERKKIVSVCLPLGD
jgi:hypothetical protein